MDVFHNLWNAIRASAWFYELPLWLREPAAFFGTAAALIVVPLLLGRWWWRRRRRDFRRSDSNAARRALRRDIRDCRRRGDHLEAGRGLESLGRHRTALKAYRRGGHHAAAADLLRRRGRTAKAKATARQAGLWELVAELHEADGELAEAAVAYERAGMINAAADCFERAGVHHEAAYCYLRADMHAKAIELLMMQAGDASADHLETAVRAALRQQEAGTGSPPDPRLAAAVRRCAQLWLEQGDAERAYQVAADGEEWQAAVPIARDHLPPRAETAAACAAAGVHLAAAEIFEKLGDTRREALERAQHFQQRDAAAEAARWYEIAEEWDLAAEHWAASGHSAKAAELFAKSGDYQTAGELYAQAGDPDRQQEMMVRASSLQTPEPLTASQRATEDSVPRASRERPSGVPAGQSAGGERYVLREELGRGGMGVVYRADDLLLQRAVAYKALAREKLRGEGDAERLLSEARAAARLSHPNIVQVYDAGRDARGFFIVMELVEGKNFAELLAERKLSVRGAVRVGRQICSALAHAHQRRIIHRDLKPSNLLWPPEKRVKLTDFGLARAFEAAAGQVVTRPAGTPYYMAPEQIRGEAVDPRTDLYSLGCVLYELLTRKGPFEGGGSIHHHLRTPPSDPRALRPEIPAELAALILCCLEKEPDQRPASAKELGRALASL